MEQSLNSPRQLKLLHLENPLTLRFGNEFFRSIPRVPGVYFFRDSDEKLLYIGQSSDLRARLSSYRHVTPEKNPKRTLRLVSRVKRIVWEECGTAGAAIERERLLLLEHRPPFNRAGVWKREPWWLAMDLREGAIHVALSREAVEGSVGPLPSSFRYVFASLLRCMLRVASPDLRLSDYPHGWFAPVLPLTLRLSLLHPPLALQRITSCMAGDVTDLLAAMDALPVISTLTEQEYWLEERERLEKYAAKIEPPPSQSSSIA